MADISNLKERAEAYLTEGKLELAKECYLEAIAHSPNQAQLYHKLGEVCGQQEKWNDAVDAYLQAIRINPNFYRSYYKLGDVLTQLGSYRQAVEAYKMAIKIQPEFPWSYQKLGEVLMGLENWEDALACFIQLLQIKPERHPTYKKTIADMLEKQGKLKAAQSWKESFKLPQDVVKKYCKLTGDYQVKSKLEPGIFYQTIYPETSAKSRRSQTIGKKASDYFEITNIKIREAFVAVLPEGRAWADRQNSVVITSDNKLVQDLYTGCGEIVFSSKRLTPFQYIDGTVAFLSVKYSGMYYHWMFDVIPRFHLLDRSDIKLSEIDHFVINKCQHNFQITTLKKLGIPGEKILENCGLHLKAKRLVVPSLSGGWRAGYWAGNFLRSQFLTDLEKNQKGEERIYISRKLASRRRVVNEEEVVEFLEKLGFVRVILESMSVEEQARCLAAAKVVIGPHGGGLTNLVFCSPGTKAIEFFPPEYVKSCYWQLTNLYDLEHYYLMGDKFDDDNDYQNFPVNWNILVNLKKLSKLLKKAGVV